VAEMICRCAPELTRVVDLLIELEGAVSIQDWAVAESKYDTLSVSVDSLERCLGLRVGELRDTRRWLGELKEAVYGKDVIRSKTGISAVSGRIVHEVCRALGLSTRPKEARHVAIHPTESPRGSH